MDDIHRYLSFVRKTVPHSKERIEEKLEKIKMVLDLRMNGFRFADIANRANISESYAQLIFKRYLLYLKRPRMEVGKAA